MKLPNGDRAHLGDKIVLYCLNFRHHKGKDKAALFRNRLGITLENRKKLENALLRAAFTEDATVTMISPYGVHYNTHFFMKTSVGESWVLGCWIVRKDEDFPRLTNAYPVRKGVRNDD